MKKSFLRVLFCFVVVQDVMASLSDRDRRVNVDQTLKAILGSSASYSNLRARVLSSTTVTTSDCSAIRSAPYPAELQLFYEYSVEFNPGRAVNLVDLERAIANVVAIQLSICDTSGQPVFKVLTGTPHRFSDKSKSRSEEWFNVHNSSRGTTQKVQHLSIVCRPKENDNNGCIVVKGQTSSLLDNDSSLVRNTAYDAIENGLLDPDLLDGYTDSVVRTAFLSRGDAFLLEAGQASNLSNDRGSRLSPITATIAVAAASVSFVVASVFCYGFMNRNGRHHPEPSVRHKGRALKTRDRKVASGSLGGRARRHFVRLEDLSASSISHVTPSLTPMSQGYDCDFEETDFQGHVDGCNPAIAWSVSDITSDSVSVRSGVSRTPSTLERIEEEEEDREKDSDFESLAKENATGTSQVREKVEDYDCRSLRRSEMMDVSDLDACFTIAPTPKNAIPSGTKSDSREKSGDVEVNGVTYADISAVGYEETEPDTSDSDFSGSSLLVLPDFAENVHGTVDVISETKIETIDASKNTLQFSCSKSDDTTKFLNDEAQVDGDVGDISVTETETSSIQQDNEDFSGNNEYDSVNNQTKPGEENGLRGNNGYDSAHSLNNPTEGPTTTESSGAEHPSRSGERKSNADDSIDEWVSELLEQYSSQ
jgi:hypothetical protein